MNDWIEERIDVFIQNNIKEHKYKEISDSKYTVKKTRNWIRRILRIWPVILAVALTTLISLIIRFSGC